MRVLLALVSAVVLSGCCVLDGTCDIENSDAGFEAPPPQSDSLTSPGCSDDSIEVQGAVVCASCDFADDAICGAPDEALCEVRENSFGEKCQLCVTDGGAILYDDCFTGDAAREASFCELSDGGSEDEACSVCFDDNGNTVSTTCGPRSDECTEVVGADGRLCTRCTADGQVVSNVCESVDIDPRLCRSYGDEQGSCVDCFGDDDTLLSHFCTPAGGPTAVSCQETVQPEGLVCTVCTDENGTTIDRSCQQSLPELDRCGQLVYTEQTCIVCVDDVNAVLFIDCQRNDCGLQAGAACRLDADCATGEACFDGACVAQNSGAPPPDDDEAEPGRPAPPAEVCEAPPACSMNVDADGAVCRTCPLTGADGTSSTETRCVAAGLACDVVPESEVNAGAEDDGGNDFAPEDPQANNCVVCTDSGSGVEVYRDCGSNGSVPPPYCLNEDSGDGNLCSVCFDAVTDAAIYTSCGDETCFALQSEVLVDAEQAPLLVDGEVASVACKQCGAPDADTEGLAAEAAFSATCSLENVCQDAFGTSFNDCPATTTMTIAPFSCENPWDAWVFGAGDVELLQGVLAFALGERAVALAAASIVVDQADGFCEACSCETGMRIELRVADADVDVVAELFGRTVVPVAP